MLNLNNINFIEDFTPPKRNSEERYSWLKLLLVLVVTTLAFRSFDLQIMRGHTLQLQAEDNRIAIIPHPAPRGLIYDQHNQQLIENVASTDLFLDYYTLPAREHEAPIIEVLTKYLNLTPDEIKQALTLARQQHQAVLLKKDLDHDLVVTLENAAKDLPSIRLVSSSIRNYLYAYSISHLLGYTGLATTEELDRQKNITMNDTVGKAGIEKRYDDLLRGRPGVSYVEVNAAGLPQKELGSDQPTLGQDLHLTIDAKLHDFIFSLLAEKNATGSVIVMDPRSGAILALVNYPAFDPNIFVKPSRQEELKRVLADKRQPLFNRAISGTYPPGSIIKPLLAAAGLQENIIDQQTSVLSTGGLHIGVWNFPDWKAGGHGRTNVTKAIAESVNTFFYILAGGDKNTPGLGPEKINHYLKLFSWGRLTGIDLPNETKGLIPSPRWKQETKNEAWYIGDTYHLGIGQGDVLVTPLQVAVSTSAIANLGTVYQPHLLAEKVGQRNSQIKHTPQGTKLPLKKEYLRLVQAGMRQAVTQGSARRLANLPVPVAGKTGTAQFGSGKDETHAWFTSFGPYQNPRLVVTVLLEHGGAGDVNAVPIAQEIWQWWAENSNFTE